MHKHSYAYGHKLVFDSSHKKKVEGGIYISKCAPLSLNNYSHKLFFKTNQGRTIFICSPSPLDIEKSKWAFVVEDCITFVCDIKEKSICYIEGEHYSEKLMEYWLVHIVLPLFWTLEGSFYFLHTGSVLIEGKAVLFMGESYAGKSTMTDLFLQKQHPLLSDDKLATFYDDKSKMFKVYASHPYHRPYRAREDLGKRSENFQEGSFDIDRLYWLQPVESDKDVKITELKGIKKFERLRYSTEMHLSLLDSKERFNYITQFANHVVMYELEVPNDLSKLPKVYDTIMKHLRGEQV